MLKVTHLINRRAAIPSQTGRLPPRPGYSQPGSRQLAGLGTSKGRPSRKLHHTLRELPFPGDSVLWIQHEEQWRGSQKVHFPNNCLSSVLPLTFAKGIDENTAFPTGQL